MHCRLAVGAAATVREAMSAAALRSALRASSVPIFDERSTAKNTETTVNDRLLPFMIKPPACWRSIQIKNVDGAFPVSRTMAWGRQADRANNPPPPNLSFDLDQAMASCGREHCRGLNRHDGPCGRRPLCGIGVPYY